VPDVSTPYKRCNSLRGADDPHRPFAPHTQPHTQGVHGRMMPHCHDREQGECAAYVACARLRCVVPHCSYHTGGTRAFWADLGVSTYKCAPSLRNDALVLQQQM
jgi:hypothetical protein